MFHKQWKVQIMAQSVSVGDSSLKVTAAKNPDDDGILCSTQNLMFYEFSYLTAKSKFHATVFVLPYAY